MCPARLFIIGEGEILSKKKTTQGDATSMDAYALGILPLLQFLLNCISVNKLNTNDVTFADGITVAGKFSCIKDQQSQLTSISPKYGYFPKASKSYLIVKGNQLTNAIALFDNSNVNITVKGKRHFEAIIGSDGYKREYVDELAKDWNSHLWMLSTVVESHRRVAYSAFVGGFNNKLCYFIRTILDISNFLLPIEDTIRN